MCRGSELSIAVTLIRPLNAEPLSVVVCMLNGLGGALIADIIWGGALAHCIFLLWDGLYLLHCPTTHSAYTIRMPTLPHWPETLSLRVQIRELPSAPSKIPSSHPQSALPAASSRTLVDGHVTERQNPIFESEEHSCPKSRRRTPGPLWLHSLLYVYSTGTV